MPPRLIAEFLVSIQVSRDIHERQGTTMHEVDYLWVGEKSNTGDAIACRFTEPQTQATRVVVIDGGFRETGERIADLIEKYYKTSVIDLVVCTHPDDDHVMGLFALLERMEVRRLLIHRPSRYGFTAKDGVKSDLVEDLVDTALRNGVTVDDAFYAGTTYFQGALAIAGPSEDYYAQLLAEQKGISASAVSKMAHAAPVFASAVARKVRSLFGDPGETMTGDNGGTTPRNNSSMILDLQVDGRRALFSGDAGAPALERAADKLDNMGRSGPEIDLFHFPHHGSRHNLTPGLLDRLLGLPREGAARGISVASVGKEAHDHPRPEVANAIKRRGYPVFCTRGISLRWHSPDAPFRAEYASEATPLEWLDESDPEVGAA